MNDISWTNLQVSKDTQSQKQSLYSKRKKWSDLNYDCCSPIKIRVSYPWLIRTSIAPTRKTKWLMLAMLECMRLTFNHKEKHSTNWPWQITIYKKAPKHRKFNYLYQICTAHLIFIPLDSNLVFGLTTKTSCQ